MGRTPARRVEEAYKDGEGVFMEAGRDTLSVLAEAGITHEAVRGLLDDGVVESSEEDVKAKL